MNVSGAKVKGVYTFTVMDKDTNEIKQIETFENDIHWTSMMSNVRNTGLDKCVVYTGTVEETGIESWTSFSYRTGPSASYTSFISNESNYTLLKRELSKEQIDGVLYRKYEEAVMFIFKNFTNSVVLKSVAVGSNYYQYITSFTNIKQNNVPFTITVTDTDILQVNYAIIVYDRETAPDVNNIVRVNGVNHSVVIKKNGNSPYINVRDSVNGSLSNFRQCFTISLGSFYQFDNINATQRQYVSGFYATSPSGARANIRTNDFSTVLLEKNSSEVKIGTRIFYPNSNIPNDTLIYSFIFTVGLSSYHAEFTPPIKKVEYMELTLTPSLTFGVANVG